MDNEMMSKLKEKLLKERDFLEEELSSFAHKDPGAKGGWDSDFPSFGEHTSEQDENSDETQEFFNELSTEDALENHLHNINLAIEKLAEGEDGSYGICESCGEKIENERLEIEPSARTHVHCK